MKTYYIAPMEVLHQPEPLVELLRQICEDITKDIHRAGKPHIKAEFRETIGHSYLDDMIRYDALICINDHILFKESVLLSNAVPAAPYRSGVLLRLLKLVTMTAISSNMRSELFMKNKPGLAELWNK